MSDNYFDEAEFEEKFSTQTLIRIVKLGMNHWLWMIGFLVGIAAIAVLEAYLTFLAGKIVDLGIVARDQAMLTKLSIQYGLIWLPFGAFVFMFIIAAGYLGQLTQYDLRKALFNHLQELEVAYFSHTPTGWLQARVASDTTRVGDLVSWGFLDITWSVMNIIASIVFMLYINWQLALVIALIIPLLVVIAGQFQRRILREYRHSRKANSQITSSFSESLLGVRVVKSLRREQPNLDNFEGLTNEMFQAAFRAASLSAMFLPIVQIVSASAIAVIVWLGGWQFEQGWITIGGIQAFVGYVTFMLWPVQMLAQVYASMQQAIASAERVFMLIDMQPTIQNLPQAVEVDSIAGEIIFENVDFHYGSGKEVLNGFNLRVREGERIALVGSTGAGKSTIVNLLCRFYEPTGGRILMNGRDYRDLTLHSIHSHIGMVLQTPHLFGGTIMDNIRYGRLNANDEEVIEAAKLAGAHDFIERLTNGYNAQVGEGGILLSVGQKQLISLARAVLAQPDIFIMDEATSSVDTLTEALIQKGMETLMHNRTSFIIAHRLSTIKHADRILVLENGKIIESGSHAELISMRGHYYNLYTKQFRREREADFDWSMAFG